MIRKALAGVPIWHVISHDIVHNLTQDIAYRISHDIADR
jgi:hypothetical protein